LFAYWGYLLVGPLDPPLFKPHPHPTLISTLHGLVGWRFNVPFCHVSLSCIPPPFLSLAFRFSFYAQWAPPFSGRRVQSALFHLPPLCSLVFFFFFLPRWDLPPFVFFSAARMLFTPPIQQRPQWGSGLGAIPFLFCVQERSSPFCKTVDSPPSMLVVFVFRQEGIPPPTSAQRRKQIQFSHFFPPRSQAPPTPPCVVVLLGDSSWCHPIFPFFCSLFDLCAF